MDLHGNWPRIIHEGEGADHEGESGGLKYKGNQQDCSFLAIDWFRYRAKVKDASGASAGRCAWDVFLQKSD